MAVVLLPELIGIHTMPAILLLIVPHAVVQVVVLERYLRRRPSRAASTASWPWP